MVENIGVRGKNKNKIIMKVIINGKIMDMCDSGRMLADFPTTWISSLHVNPRIGKTKRKEWVRRNFGVHGETTRTTACLRTGRSLRVR